MRSLRPSAPVSPSRRRRPTKPAIAGRQAGGLAAARWMEYENRVADGDLGAVGGGGRTGTGLAGVDCPPAVEQPGDLLEGAEHLGHRRTGDTRGQVGGWWPATSSTPPARTAAARAVTSRARGSSGNCAETGSKQPGSDRLAGLTGLRRHAQAHVTFRDSSSSWYTRAVPPIWSAVWSLAWASGWRPNG
jgi:hypothetical protein